MSVARHCLQADCNIFTFTIREAEDRKRLERDGHYHFGEVITKFLPGKLSTQDTHELQIFEPELLFFTSSGRIGVIVHANDDVALDLTALQNNMAAEIVGPGEVNHSKYVSLVYSHASVADRPTSDGGLRRIREAVATRSIHSVSWMATIWNSS